MWSSSANSALLLSAFVFVFLSVLVGSVSARSGVAATTQPPRILKPLGVECAHSSECNSTFCADGFCCNSACSNACQVCGVDGLCTSAQLGTDPRGLCDDRNPCNGKEVCNSNGKCEIIDWSTVEQPCASDSENLKQTCSEGICDPILKSCRAYADPTLGTVCGLTSTGSCTLGKRACNSFTGIAYCNHSISPALEGPNMRDDDCDGIIDNNTPVACSTSSDCQDSTFCMQSQCTGGYCQYVPRNVGQDCPSRDSPCLAPFKCSEDGRCQSVNRVSCGVDNIEASHASSAAVSAETVNTNVSPVLVTHVDRRCLITTCKDDLCVQLPSNGSCDDGDPCTVNDACVFNSNRTRNSPNVEQHYYTCQGTKLSCNDGNPCTVDACLPQGPNNYLCTSTPAPMNTICHQTGKCSREGVCYGGLWWDSSRVASSSDGVGIDVATNGASSDPAGKQSHNSGAIIALAIGIPIFIIFVAAMIFVVVVLVRGNSVSHKAD